MLNWWDRIATALSVWLVNWLTRQCSAEGRRWMAALSAELASIDGGWARLRWALGGVSIAWHDLQRSHHGASFVGEGPSHVRPALTGALAIAVGFELHSAEYGLFMASTVAPASWVAPAVASVCWAQAVLIALRLRTVKVAVWWAGWFASSLAQIAFRGYAGTSAIQGAPANLAVIVAGVLAAAAAWSLRGRLALDGQSSWSDRCRRILLVALVCYGVTDGVIRASFGYWMPYRDAMTPFAILATAVLGAVAGSLIGASHSGEAATTDSVQTR